MPVCFKIHQCRKPIAVIALTYSVHEQLSLRKCFHVELTGRVVEVSWRVGERLMAVQCVYSLVSSRNVVFGGQMRPKADDKAP